MRARRFIAVVTALGTLASLAAVGATTTAAAAATRTSAFTYTGEQVDTKNIIDTGLVYVDGCMVGDDPVTCFPDEFPGTLWFRARAGVKFKVLTNQAADFTLEGPDAFRQDTVAPFTTTLVAKDASGHEVRVQATPYVEVNLAYDAPLANCPKDTITTVQELMDANTEGCLNFVHHTGEIDIATVDILKKDTTLPYAGTRTLSENHEGPELDVGALFGVPDVIGLRLDLEVVAQLTATLGYQALRTLAASGDPGNPLASGTLHWAGPGPHDDQVTVPCQAPAGDNLVYRLTQNTWTGTGKVDVKPKIVVTIADPVPDITIPLGISVNLFDAAVVATAAPDFAAILGEIRPENKPPVIGAITAPTGNEGSPIQFQVVATDNCGIPTIRWDFSDGGVAFGFSPQHTFADNGVYSGMVTATDAAGNVATKAFSVTVDNVAPSVNAGPDTTSAWGRSVAFNGAATDPSPVDQATLVYTWTFGDGSPSAAGGPSVSHAYAAPGDYTATLIVCDKNGSCASDTRIVHVRKRSVTAGFLGTTSGTYDTATSLSASLVDEFGQNVANRTVAFEVGTQAVGPAATNSSGVATRAFTPELGAGSYTATASFTGDALYTGASASTGYAVNAKGTSVAYTGATSGRPNMTVSLSAVLTDATGKPLANRTVHFQLGSQAAQAVTDTNGLAATTLRLNQKNGTYLLTSTYTPVGGDVGRYLGSTTSVTFRLQTR
jgi:hypothetical protein